MVVVIIKIKYWIMVDGILGVVLVSWSAIFSCLSGIVTIARLVNPCFHLIPVVHINPGIGLQPHLKVGSYTTRGGSQYNVWNT